MPTITVNEDYSKSPRKAFLRDLNIAVANNETDKILSSLTNDIVWNLLGERTIIGKAEIADMFPGGAEVVIEELTIRTVLVDGNQGAIHGQMRLNTGKVYAISDFYHFESKAKDAKIKEMTSFAIDISHLF
jgi:ketosteroid isomerase-like protein